MTFIFIIVLVDTNLEFAVAPLKGLLFLHVFDSGEIFYTIIIIIIYLFIYFFHRSRTFHGNILV